MRPVVKFLGAALALGLVAGAAKAQVVVSSKIDTEGGVLGNIILSVLNANGIQTTDRVQLGATPVLRQAIIAGEIDIYPEYTGNAAFFFEKADDPAWKDAAKAYELARIAAQNTPLSNFAVCSAISHMQNMSGLDAAYAEAMVAGIVNTQEAARGRLDAFARGTADKIKPG